MPTYVNSKIYHKNGSNIKIIDQSVIEENSGWLREELDRIWAAIGGETPQVTTYTIAWNNNGGTTNASGGSTSVQQGQSVTLPTSDPQRKYTITWNNNSGSGASGGTISVTYSFKGWYTAANGGTPVTASTVPTSNATYYAQWNTQNPTSITIPTTAPTRSGYTFKGWYTTSSGGNQVTSGTRTITTNTTFYAQWEVVKTALTITKGTSPTSIADGSTGTITFTTNAKATITVTTTSGTGWTAQLTSSANVTSHTIKVTNTSGGNAGTIAANAIKVTAEPTDASAYTSITTATGVNNSITLSAPQVTTYTIAWDNNGATTNASGGSTSVQQGQSVTLPTSDPQRKYTITWNNNSGLGASGGTTSVTYSFKGWYTAANGGTPVTTSTVPTSNATYYAQWNTQNPTSITIPTTAPTRSGYTFKGWYTASSGGNQVISGTRTITTNTTFYAQWEVVQATYYWYAGQTQPTSKSSVTPQDSGTFTNNNWHTINVNNTYSFSNPIYNSESNPISGNSKTNWYIALPADKSYSIYDSDDVNEVTAGNITKVSIITIANVSYNVYKTAGTLRNFIGWRIH